MKGKRMEEDILDGLLTKIHTGERIAISGVKCKECGGPLYGDIFSYKGWCSDNYCSLKCLKAFVDG